MPNNIKATATATVTNGIATTNNITYNEQLTPGTTYDINAEYMENNTYERAEGIGVLEIQKIMTTTTITGNNNITIGETITLTVVIKDNNNNNISRGSVSVYDGNNIIQSNHTITGTSTQITFIPQTAGVHDIYAIFTDNGVEYNSSTSNHLTVTVHKKTSTVTANQNSLSFYFGENATITGSLTDSSRPISSQNIRLVDYTNETIQTTSTNSSGEYSFTYNPQNRNNDGQNLTIIFDGNNEYNPSSAMIPVTILRHNVTITVPDTRGYTNSTLPIPVTLTDNNNDPVMEGTVNIDITPLLDSVELFTLPGDGIPTSFKLASAYYGPEDGDYTLIFMLDGPIHVVTEEPSGTNGMKYIIEDEEVIITLPQLPHSMWDWDNMGGGYIKVDGDNSLVDIVEEDYILVKVEIGGTGTIIGRKWEE